MPGRSKPLEPRDARFSHGTEPLLDAARGRSRSRYASGGNRLVRKQRLPANASHVARIAAAERRDLLAELHERRDGKLSVSDYTLADCVYWCTAAILTAYQFCEHHGLISDAEKSFHPVVEQTARLQRMKQAALEKLGLDRQPEPRDIWAEVTSGTDQAAFPRVSPAIPSQADSFDASEPQRSSGDPRDSGAVPGESSRAAAETLPDLHEDLEGK